jgi:N-acetylglutamate synthase-like GNAT family acetyltransferase
MPKKTILADDLRKDRRIEILEFDPRYRQAVTDLIVGIQRHEFGIDISADEQPDLASIPSFYQTGRGNFWVALDSGDVVGTISLKDIGNDQTALRKMFVHARYRGAERGVANALLATAIGWAKQRGIRAIYLGTTEAFRAAHRFYEKNGFVNIDKSELPAAFPLMRQDTRFYWLPFGESVGGGQ